MPPCSLPVSSETDGTGEASRGDILCKQRTGNRGMRELSDLPRVTEEVCEEAKNVTQSCWVSGLSPVPKRESRPETAPNTHWDCEILFPLGDGFSFPKIATYILEVGLLPSGQNTLKPRKGPTEEPRAHCCGTVYHRAGAPHRGLKPLIYSCLANLWQVFTLSG